jgi:hypothetical protein
MFLRFTKGGFNADNADKYRKCVFLGDALVMEYGNKIVGVAKLHEETDKCFDYDVVVAKGCELGANVIAAYIKNMIGKSNKFSTKPSAKRRKYFVEEVEGNCLPITAKIVFNRI